MKKCIVFWLGLACVPAVWAEVILNATYTLKWGNTTIGNVQRQLVKQGDSYTFSSFAKPQGLAVFLTKGIEEKSVFKIKNNRVEPVSYFYHQKGKKSKMVSHRYEWAAKKLTISQPKSLVVRNIDANTVDPLSSQYWVMLGLAQGKNSFKIAMYEDSATPKTYGLKHVGNIKITTPAGRFDTVLVSKVQTNQKKFNFWCAPSLNYLPVKISYVNKKGQTFTMELVRVN